MFYLISIFIAKKTRNESQNDDEFISSSQERPKGLYSLSLDIQNKLISDIVRLFLFYDTKKAVVKRDDINKMVVKEYKSKSIVNQLIHEAKKKLKDIFGFDLVELPKINNQCQIISRETGNYILIQDKSLHEYMESVRKHAISSKNKTRFPVLMILLGIVHINNNNIEESLLLKLMKKIDINEALFNEYYESFKKEMYIDRYTVKEDGELKKMIRLGSRAIIEIGKPNILRFLCKVTSVDVDPVRLKELEEENQEEDDNDENNNASSQ